MPVHLTFGLGLARLTACLAVVCLAAGAMAQETASTTAPAPLTTPQRTLSADYPPAPKITLQGLALTVEAAGKSMRYTRPMVVPFDAKPVEGGRTLHVAPGGTGDGGEGAPLG